MGERFLFTSCSIDKKSLAHVSSCEIHLGYEITVARAVLNAAAAHETEIDLNLGPPNLAALIALIG